MQKKKKSNSCTSPHADAEAAAAGRESDAETLKIHQQGQEEEKAAAAAEEEEEEEDEEEDEDANEEEDLESQEDEDGEGTSKALLVVREETVDSDVKQGRQAGGGGLLLPWLPSVCCRVEGCREDLWLAGDYHRKHRVCKTHAAADKVFINQQDQRFCQQCSRFHTLVEFDEGKRSCRKRLAYHNERRRRHQSDSVVKCNADATLSKGGSNRRSDFTAEQKRKRMKSTCEISSSPVVLIGGEHNYEKSFKPEQLLTGGSYPLPKPLKFKSARNEPEGQSIRSKSKRSKESEKDWIAPRKLDHHSSEDEIQEDVPRVSPLLLQPKMDLKNYGGAAGDTFDPQYSSSSRVGIELGDGIILPPLAIKREGKLVLLKEWPGGAGVTCAETDGEDARNFSLRKDNLNKKEWQKGDQETLFHCLWDCPKVQPVWKWAGRALSKIRGSKVSLEWKQAVLGDKLGGWALPETISVWRLLRGIILGQVWHARKGKVYSGKQWTPGQIIRSTWVDLMMYAMQEWLEVLKAKGSLKQEEAQLLCADFDKKWLVNGFVGKRTEWSMAWKDSYEVLLD